jgi:HNH endonuclease
MTTYRMKNGYTFTSVGPRKILAHRASYELFIGPIAPGLTVDHTCRVKHCVNPTHLEPVSSQENKDRYWRTLGQFRCGHPRTPENRRSDGLGCRLCALAVKQRQYRARKAMQ